MLEATYYEKRREVVQRSLDILAEMGYCFEPFDLRHRDLYLRYESKTELSCRCFLSQYVYAEEDCIYCWEDQENQCLLVIFLNSENNLCAYPPMFQEYLPERFSAAVEKLCGMFAKLGLQMRFEYAHEEDVELFAKLPCSIEVYSLPEEMDYIYEFEMLKDFSGSKNAGRRRRHNRFLNYHQVAMERIQADNAAEGYEVLNKWCAMHSCSECGHRCPKNTSERVLANLNELDAMGYLMRVDGEAQGLILMGPMSQDMMDVVMCCSTYRDSGLEETFYAMVAEQVSPPYKYMNLEEDMGIERLRLHKQTLRPCRMQKKYSIIVSENNDETAE